VTDCPEALAATRPSSDRSVAELAIVIPAYCEAESVGGVVAGLVALYPGAVIVVVDDGSRDATADAALEAGARVVRHPINLGQGAALHTGIRYALRCGAGLICTFDADGQHDATSIGAMCAMLKAQEVDVVLGSRFLAEKQHVPPFRRLTLKVALAFTRLHTGLALTDTHNGLRLMSARAASLMLPRHPGMAHASEMLDLIAAHKLRYAEIPSEVKYTTYSSRKGQRSLNAVKIVFEIAYRRLTR
jgi:glycosyltransferase involved in cell wall biosynthesis